MWKRSLLTVVVLLGAGCVGTDADAPDPDVSAGVVVAWNARLLAVAEAEDHFLTFKGVRTAAMMHAAMHDAVNAIEPRYRRYRSQGPGNEAPVELDPVAAATEAAYAVAVSQYPDRAAQLAEERDRWRRPGAGEAAMELGERVAVAVLEARRDDGWDEAPEYDWGDPGPGVYVGFPEHSGTPGGFVFGAGWGRIRPFLMDTTSAFRSPPPPAVGSPAYAEAYNEVKEVGRRESAARTADQTHLAMWWKEFVEKSHNRLARELVVEEGLDLWDAARLFALLNMSIADGYIASFESKYHYNHWRPYTAIRRAADDGNPATEPDTGWTNLHDHTYAFPSYPSAHGSVCGAAMTVLAGVFGSDRSVDMTIPAVDVAGPMSGMVANDPPTRSFGSFAEAAEECSLSRVYLGIHFRYDSEAGTVMGRQVGRLALEEYLTPM